MRKTNDLTGARLRNEIAEIQRPKPVRIVRHDADHERAELR